MTTPQTKVTASPSELVTHCCRHFFDKSWITLGMALAWFFILLWPLLGIKPEGLELMPTLRVYLPICAVVVVLFSVYRLKSLGLFDFLETPADAVREQCARVATVVPNTLWIFLAVAAAVAFPMVMQRYAIDTAINVLIYVCLGLGLNVVVGLCGLLDLGFIAFYGVGAYTYALLNTFWGVPFWVAIPFSVMCAAIAGCIVGYPTLRMRGDYLAIVTLGFGEIIRIIMNNWMSLTNGPNGVLGIDPAVFIVPIFEGGLTFEYIWLKQLHYVYYIILAFAIITIVGVYRLNHSRIGRAWEAIREDETAAELMGVNIFRFKLLAYAMGAVFGGLAGAFFAARMRFVSPESFTFLESAMVLAMVVLGGMGSIPGVILGAAVLIILPEVFRDFELYRMLVFGGVMTAMMVFRPKGLWPAKRMGKRSEESE